MKHMTPPLISVVIPTYNHGHLFPRALQSVMEQTYPNWEVIVIDNHSTDNTTEVLRNFGDPRITTVKIHNNGVIAASRNMGVRRGKGEWVAFLDSDDWWLPDKLQLCMNIANGQTALIYHDLEIITNQPQLLRRKKIKSWQVTSPVVIDLLLKGNAIANSSVVVRRNWLEQIGGIAENKDMIASEDYNTWLRIAQLTEKLVYLPKKLGFYLEHNQSMSKKDMSVSERHAVAMFLHLLNEEQKLKLEARLRFTRGRFHYCNGNFAEAKDNLLFGLLHGHLMLKTKALVLLFMQITKNTVQHD